MNVTRLQIMGNASPNSARVVFPKEIAHLKYLKFLGIERTNIDAFPEEMNILNIEEFQSVDNIFLHLTDFAPIYKTNNLKSFRVVNFTDFFYDLSDTYKMPSQIPDELLNNKELKHLSLMCCNLSGEIPDKLWKLTNLENLELYNIRETYLYGTIPPAIANLHNLKTLRFFNLNLSGGIPEELYTLNQLEHLTIDCCNIGGHLSSNIQNLKN
jgi:Leucine-rich repeat (LRR) protein